MKSAQHLGNIYVESTQHLHTNYTTSTQPPHNMYIKPTPKSAQYQYKIYTNI